MVLIVLTAHLLVVVVVEYCGVVSANTYDATHIYI
jgi:hypothetical protein